MDASSNQLSLLPACLSTPNPSSPDFISRFRADIVQLVESSKFTNIVIHVTNIIMLIEVTRRVVECVCHENWYQSRQSIQIQVTSQCDVQTHGSIISMNIL